MKVSGVTQLLVVIVKLSLRKKEVHIWEYLKHEVRFLTDLPSDSVTLYFVFDEYSYFASLLMSLDVLV